MIEKIATVGDIPNVVSTQSVQDTKNKANKKGTRKNRIEIEEKQQ